MNLYDMKFGESRWHCEMRSNILRVPGGWIFRTSDNERDIYISSVFVPFNNEFMQESEDGVSPNSAQPCKKEALRTAYCDVAGRYCQPDKPCLIRNQA